MKNECNGQQRATKLQGSRRVKRTARSHWLKMASPLYRKGERRMRESILPLSSEMKADGKRR